MPKFDLDSYETVEDRLVKFWAQHPEGRIESDLIAYGDNQFIVKSMIYFDAASEKPTATGLAEEMVGASPVNKTSALENCETSAIGRALANCGYAAKGKRPSREEMEKVQRGAPAPALTKEEVDTLDALYEKASSITDIDGLKSFYEAVSADPICKRNHKGTTLIDLITKTKKTIQEGESA